MIKSLTVTNHLDESLTVTLADGDPQSGLLLTKITGLGPVKADVNITDIITLDGGHFNSSRLSSRNIVIYFQFQEAVDENGNVRTIEDVRQLTYKYFPSKQMINILFHTDNLKVNIKGVVESNEPDIFSEAEITQISIVCPDPFFYSAYDNQTVFYSIEPLFEFPFENNGIVFTETLLTTDKDKVITDESGNEISSRKYSVERHIEFGNYVYEKYKSIFYSGEDTIGVVFTIHALGDVKNINIYNIDTREKMSINTEKIKTMTGKGFTTSDDIIISTVRGDLYAKLLRNGRYTNIINCINKDADWFKISKGDNVFAYTAEDGIENLLFTINNKVKYGGI